MDALLQHLSSLTVAIPILVLAVCSVYKRLTAVSLLPEGVPWVGRESSKLFADTRAILASFNRGREWLETGYNQVDSPLLLFRLGTSALMELHSMARTICPTLYPTCQANPKLFYPLLRRPGFLIRQTTSLARLLPTTTPSKVTTTSLALKFSRIHSMTMSSINTYRGGLVR